MTEKNGSPPPLLSLSLPLSASLIRPLTAPATNLLPVFVCLFLNNANCELTLSYYFARSLVHGHTQLLRPAECLWRVSPCQLVAAAVLKAQLCPGLFVLVF